MDTQSQTPFYLDKGLWLALLSPLFVFLSNRFGLTLDAGEILGLVLPVVTYIVMHKYKSGKVLAEEIRAEAQKTAAAAPVPASPAAALAEAAK